MKHVVSFVIILIAIAGLSCDSPHVEAGEYIKNGDHKFPELVSFSIYAGLDEYKCFINQENKTVSQAIPYGIDRSSLSVSMESTEKARYFLDNVEIYNNDALDFSNPFTMRLKDPGGEYTDYEISITNAANIESQIYSFAIQASGREYVSQVDSQTIYAYVPFGTDLSAVSIYYIASVNAELSVADSIITPESKIDLSKDVTLTVTAQDSRFKRDYRIIVKYQQNTKAELTSFYIPTGMELYNCRFIDGQAEVSVKYGTNTNAIIPRFTLSYGAQLYDANGVEIISGETALSFPKGETVTFTVVSEDGLASKDYAVLINELPNHEANITSFKIIANNTEYFFSIVGNTISRTLPPQTNIADASTLYEASAGASVIKLAGENTSTTASGYVTQRFYRVTSSDGVAVQDYIVNITVLKNDQASISNYSLGFNNGPASCVQQLDGTGNPLLTNGKYHFDCVAPFGSNLASGTVAFTLPTGATVAIKQGANPDDPYTPLSDANPYDPEQKFNHSYDFTSQVEYKIVSENGQNTAYYGVATQMGCGSPTVIQSEPTFNFNNANTFGRFKEENDIELVDSCGYDLLYTYGDDLTDSSIYDSNAGGAFTNGYFRLMVNDKNVTDPTHLNGGLRVRAMNLGGDYNHPSFVAPAPPLNEVYIDPETGRYSLPMPLLLHTFDKTTPDINTISGGLYTLDTSQVPITSHFEIAGGGLYLQVPESNPEKNVYADYYPFQSGRVMNCDKGTAAFTMNVETSLGSNDYYGYFMLEITGGILFVRSFSSEHGGWDRYSIAVYSHLNKRWESGGMVYSPTFLQYRNFYLIWDKNGGLQNSKTIKLYADGTLILQTANLFNQTTSANTVVARFHLRNQGINDANYVKMSLQQLKLWDHAVSEDAGWISGVTSPTAVHVLYGQANGYLPTLKAGYHTFD